MLIKKERHQIDEQKGIYKYLGAEKDCIEQKLLKLKEENKNVLIAEKIIQEVSQKTQQLISFKISEPITKALQTILCSNIKFITLFKQKRGKTECNLLFEEYGNQYVPLKESTGGGIDVASFILRLTLLQLSNKRNLIVLDEPFKHLDTDKHELMGELLQELTKKLNIQFIICTHSKRLAKYGNKVFHIYKNKGRSYYEKQT